MTICVANVLIQCTLWAIMQSEALPGFEVYGPAELFWLAPETDEDPHHPGRITILCQVPEFIRSDVLRHNTLLLRPPLSPC